MPLPEAVHAWVESPLQLLSVLEAHGAGLLGGRTIIVPRADVPSLAPTAAHLTAMGLPAGLTIAEPSMRDGSVVGAGPCGAHGTWVVGDAFSGRVQRSLVFFRPAHLVVVDDGRATLHLLATLAAGHGVPLRRARVATNAPWTDLTHMPRHLLGIAAGARLRAAAAAGQVTVVTAVPVDHELQGRAERLGLRVVVHSFRWLRAQPTTVAPAERTIVLGSAMVRDQLVQQRPYLDWVTSRAGTEPLAYFPHRREDASTLAVLRRAPGVQVYDTEPGVPVELTLRGLTARHRVVSLPTTAALTLRTVLADRGTDIRVDQVPGAWWTPGTSAAVREHLGAHDESGPPVRAGTLVA